MRSSPSPESKGVFDDAADGGLGLRVRRGDLDLLEAEDAGAIPIS